MAQNQSDIVEQKQITQDDQFQIRDKRANNRYFVDNNLLRGGWGREIGPHGIAVYNAIALHADNNSQSCYPSHNLIAQLTGMSRPTVIKAMQVLIKWNIIAIEKREGRNHIYYLLSESEWIPVNEVDTPPVNGVDRSRGVNEVDTPPVNEVDTPPVNEVDTNNTHDNNTQDNNTHDSLSAKADEAPKPPTGKNALVQELVSFFCECTQLAEPVPKTAKQGREFGTLWKKPLLAIAQECDLDLERSYALISWAIQHADAENLTVKSPLSIQGIACGEQAKRRRAQTQRENGYQADARAVNDAAEARLTARQQEEPPSEEAELWALCLEELAVSLGDAFWHVQMSEIVSRDNGRLIVQVRSEESAEWCNERLRGRIEGAVQRATGEALTVECVAEEVTR